MTKTKLFIIFVILIIATGLLQNKHDKEVNYHSEKKVFVMLPPGKYLKILSFGYDNLVSDLLFIWSIQFYSSYNLTNRYDYIWHIFNTITDLTPQYEAPYIVGAWIMALEAKKYDLAVKLLQKGSKNNKDNYIFDYEAGFYAYQNLKDYELADKLFKRASERPDAPSIIRGSRAHMVYMKNDLNFAWRLWIDIYKNAKTLLEKDSSFNHLYQIKYELDKKNLEQKINQFKNIAKRFPVNLDELIRYRLLKEIPRDFKGDLYIYDPKTGKVSARKSFRWKKS
jgi:hypothetical protein